MSAFTPTSASLQMALAYVDSRHPRMRALATNRQLLQSVQERRLKALVHLAYASSPLYAEHYRAAGIDPKHFALGDLPVVDKRLLMERWSEALTVRGFSPHGPEPQSLGGAVQPSRRTRYLTLHSSGTSGRPGVFVFRRRYFRAMMAHVLAYRPAPLRQAGRLGTRVAGMFSADPYHLGYATFGAVQSPFFAARIIPAVTDTDDAVQRLNAFQPHILAGYPSVLRRLCPAVADGRLRISPEAVCCGGETLAPADRQAFADTFQAPVCDFYGAAEANPIAVQCPSSSALHIVESFVIVESIDAAGRPVEEGRLSEACLVTNLHATLMPVIRYRLDDRIRVVSGRCECGSTFRRIVEIEGRTSDSLVLRAKEGGTAEVHPSVIRAALERAPDIAQAQIILEEVSRLRLRVVRTRRGLRPEDLAALQRAVLDSLAQTSADLSRTTVVVEEASEIAPDPVSGKVSGFVSRLAAPPSP